jgi:hypothetical protein
MTRSDTPYASLYFIMNNFLVTVIFTIVLGVSASWIFSVLKNHKILSDKITTKSISFLLVISAILLIIYYIFWGTNNYIIEEADAEYLVYSRYADIKERPEPDSTVILSRKQGLILSVTGRVVGTNYVRVERFGIPTGYVHIKNLKEITEEKGADFFKKSDGNSLFANFYLGNAKNGVLHGKAFEAGNELMGGHVYHGFFNNGKYDGRGILYEDNLLGGSKIYWGDFVEGKKDGYGVSIHDSGIFLEAYQGKFVSGSFNGTGLFLQKIGNSFSNVLYLGEFKDGKKSGQGYEVSSSALLGHIYEGEFKDGKFHGKGKLKYSNVYTEIGRFVLGKFVEGKTLGNPKNISRTNFAKQYNKLVNKFNFEPVVSDNSISSIIEKMRKEFNTSESK